MRRTYLNIIYLTLILVWSIGLSFYVLKLVLGPEFYEHVRQGPTMFGDFIKFYSLGQMIWAKQTAQLYDPAVQLDYYNQLIAPASVSRLTFSEYPPHFMLILSLLPLLPLNFSFLIWTFGGLIIAIGSLNRVAMARRVSGLTVLVISLAMIASLPGFRTVGFGQVSWLYLSIISLWCWAVLKKRQFIEGVALALSTLKFQYTPFLLLPALVGRRKSTFVAFVLSELVFLLFSGLVLGWSNVFGYPGALHGAENLTGENGFSQEMVNLRGLLSNMLLPTPALYVSLLFVPVAMAVVYLCIRNKAEDNWICSLTILASLCFSPHTFIYDWVLLTLPAILLFNSTSSQSIKGILGLEIWFYPLISWLVFLLPLPLDLRMQLASLYGLLMFSQCIVDRRLFSHQGSTTDMPTGSNQDKQ